MVTIEGWCGPVQVDRIKGKKVTVVPILRAGLGMMEGVLEPYSKCENQCGRNVSQRRNFRTCALFQKIGAGYGRAFSDYCRSDVGDPAVQ